MRGRQRDYLGHMAREIAAARRLAAAHTIASFSRDEIAIAASYTTSCLSTRRSSNCVVRIISRMRGWISVRQRVPLKTP